MGGWISAEAWIRDGDFRHDPGDDPVQWDGTMPIAVFTPIAWDNISTQKLGSMPSVDPEQGVLAHLTHKAPFWAATTWWHDSRPEDEQVR